MASMVHVRGVGRLTSHYLSEVSDTLPKISGFVID
jgi:hypothetical protein